MFLSRFSIHGLRLCRCCVYFALLLAATGCEQSGPLDNAFKGELYDRFTAKVLLSADALPPVPSGLEFVPGKSEFVVLGKLGHIRHYAMEADSIRLLGEFQVPNVAPAPGELGLNGGVFDPDFSNNPWLYIAYATADNKTDRIGRLRWEGSYADIAGSLTDVIVVDRGFPDEPQHAVYDVVFDETGHLVTAIGDAGQHHLSQVPTSLRGKLIRIKPQATSYSVPADNPWFSAQDTLPEIAAMGLRTPWRLAVYEDKIYIADVGQNRYEELNVYLPGARNFGWPDCEGVCAGRGFDDPALAISHADPFYQTDDPEDAVSGASSIAVGVAYAGLGPDPYNDLLDGRLLFFDVFQGYVRAARIEADGALRDDQHIFHFDFIGSMATGPDGFVYGVSLFNSRFFRVELK